MRKGSDLSLHLNPGEVYIADGSHNGLIKYHLDRYLNHRAQKAIDDFVAKHKDIEAATIFCESQMILIEAKEVTETPEELKRISAGLCRAIQGWYNKLDGYELDFYSYHPNPRREAAESYSEVPTYHSAEVD